MLCKTFQVRVCKHPIDRSPVSVDAFIVVARNQTLRTILRKYRGKNEYEIVLNGKHVPQDQLKSTHVKVGDTVDLVPAVGFLDLIWAAAVFIWDTGIIVNLALAFAFSYLGGILFGQDPKEVDDRDVGSLNYSWNPKTQRREGIPRPKPYGEVMLHGNVIAQWTDVESNNEVLYTIVDHGDGPIAGLGANIVYLNDQPEGNYDGVTTQERLGTMSQTVMTGFEKLKIEYTLNSQITYSGDPLVFTTPNNFFDDLEFTVAFPNGLISYAKDGDVRSGSCRIKCEVSPRGLNTWTTVYDETITGTTRHAYYVNVKLSELDVPYVCSYGTQYDMRFTRLSADDGSTKVSVSYIKSIREVVDTAFTYPGRALIGVKAVGTDRLSGDMDVKCIRQGRIVNVYDGSSWSLEYSNNRAWVVLDIITQPVISGTGDSGDPYVIERYEGVDPANVDLAFFYEWAVWCAYEVPDGKGGTEERSVCNYIVDEKRSLFSLAHELAQVGRVKLYWEGTTLTGWLDAEVTNETDLMTCDNIMARSWRNAWSGKEEMAGTIEVFYNDEDNGYERTPYKYSNEDSGPYTKIVSVECSGETRRSGSVRFASYTLLRNQLIRNVNKFTQLKDALRHKLGDVIRVQHRVPNWGTHYRVVTVDSNLQTITFDRKITGASVGDLVYIRAYSDASGVDDVIVESYTIDTISGSTITVVETFDPVPIKDDIAAIASSESGASNVTVLRRIIQLEPRVDNYCDVTVETYDATLYDSDLSDPINPNPNYVWPAVAKRKGLADKEISWPNIIDAINRLIPPALDTDVPIITNVEWTIDSGGGTVYWTARDGDYPITFRYQGTTYDIDPGSTDKQFIYWDPDFSDRFLTTDTSTVAVADDNWPVYIFKDGVGSQAVGIKLLHAGLILAGTIRAESYAELRQTMSWVDGDSLDASKPYTFDFKIPSETTSIISALLSFKIKPYRAYSSGALSSGDLTSNNSLTSTTTDADGAGSTNSGNGMGTGSAGGGSTGNQAVGSTDSQYLSSVPGSHYHSMSSSSHSHSVSSHYHTESSHSHGLPTHTHGISGLSHFHITPGHTHAAQYGIFEETNAVNVDFHIDDGAGFGAQVGSYNSDQLDIDIASHLTGTGWKAIRFDADARCRVVAILEVKVDITA